MTASQLAANPLRDPRVRKRAVAGDQPRGIRDRVMDGFSAPTGQLMPAGASGYDPAIKPDPYDPEQAKKLLATAGYPERASG